MSTTSTIPYDWLRSLPPSLLEVDEVPLMGNMAPFPWKNLAESIAKQFEISKFSLAPSDFQWTEANELLAGLNNDPYILHFGITGYKGTATIIIDKKDLEAAVYLFLLHSAPDTGLLDLEQQKTFLNFFTAAFCDQFSNTNWEKGLQIHQEKDAPLAQEPHLAMDIHVEIPDRSCLVRLLISNTLRKEWKEKHIVPFEIALNPPLAKKLKLPVSIEGGYVNMKLNEWEKVHPGDFLMLDSCTINQNLQEGSLLLRVYHLPYYKANLSNGNITLEEQPTYNEIESTMPIKKDDDSDFDFDEDSENEQTEHEDEDEDSDFNFDEDSDFDFDDSDISEDLDSDDDIESKAAAPVAPTAAETKTPSAGTPAAPSQAAKIPAEAGKQAHVEKTSPHHVTSPKDIPLHIVVEVGRFEMSIDKMMELQPGNMLSLHVRPEDGVDLVVNGRRIGKGELLKFGESLGVRITEIG